MTTNTELAPPQGLVDLLTLSTPTLRFQYDDGGRKAAGFTGSTGDCVTRAISIATGLDYREVYDDLFERQRVFVDTSRSRKARKARESANLSRHYSPRSGVWKEVLKPYIVSLGWTWTPTMAIGTGTTNHLRPGEVPMDGPAICSVSKHLVAVVDGVLRDTYDCSRDGTRAVYGVWTPNGWTP